MSSDAVVLLVAALLILVGVWTMWLAFRQQEGSAEPMSEKTVLDILLDYGRGQQPLETDKELLELAGYVNAAGFFTDAAIDIMEEHGVPMSDVHLLILGTQVTVLGEDSAGQSTHINIKPGSSLIVLFGGTERRHNLRYWDCYAGDKLPMVRVAYHSKHRFETHRWPDAVPLAGRINYVS